MAFAIWFLQIGLSTFLRYNYFVITNKGGQPLRRNATQTKVQTVGDKQLVKTVSWYDNEMSYVSQLVRTVKHFAGLIS